MLYQDFCNRLTMKTQLLIILFSLLPCSAFSQFYPFEVGGVGGYSSGLNCRAYLGEHLSYETLLSIRNDGLQLHLFRQKHEEIKDTPSGSLQFVYGVGAHAGFYFTDNYNVFYHTIYFGEKIFTPAVGVDGYAALEYRLYDIPFSVGIRYKPFMEISLKQIFGINLWDVGVTFKYRFKPDDTMF